MHILDDVLFLITKGCAEVDALVRVIPWPAIVPVEVNDEPRIAPACVIDAFTVTPFLICKPPAPVV